MTVHRNPGKSSNYSIIANEAALNLPPWQAARPGYGVIPSNLIANKVEIGRVCYPSIVSDLTICPPVRVRGIYLLLRAEIVVYVGASNSSIAQRLKRHARGDSMSFDGYTIIDSKRLSAVSLWGAEQALIRFFGPEYNNAHVDHRRRLHISCVDQVVAV